MPLTRCVSGASPKSRRNWAVTLDYTPFDLAGKTTTSYVKEKPADMADGCGCASVLVR